MYNIRVNEYRISYIAGKIPHWKIQHGDRMDIALTAEDAMIQVGEMLTDGREDIGDGKFRVLWDSVPAGFNVPDIQSIFSDKVIPSH
jgi:hypothetical protein